ncbi:MAG: hypothetical protein CMM45_07055 [Rhodospirillaceae bacterium]|nr:hypothetical protein [Rhodospirillaceae bacterium]
MNLRANACIIIKIALLWCLILMPTAAEAEVAVAARLTAQDKIDLKRVEDYLERLSTLKSSFLQTSSNGNVASGKLFISRPGKLRFEYDPPASILMISDGIFLIYIDKDLDQVTHIFLKSTPVNFLVREDIRMDGDITVTKITRSRGLLRLTIRDTDEPGKGSMTLIFADKPLALRKWTVIDAQNIRTNVMLAGVETGMKLDPRLFQHNQ